MHADPFLNNEASLPSPKWTYLDSFYAVIFCLCPDTRTEGTKSAKTVLGYGHCKTKLYLQVSYYLSSYAYTYLGMQLTQMYGKKDMCSREIVIDFNLSIKTEDYQNQTSLSFRPP